VIIFSVCKDRSRLPESNASFFDSIFSSDEKMEAFMQDEVSDLRLLVHLVASGSLSEAARRWNSSAPMMSRRLSAMETRLGVRLITRTSRRFILTDEGALLHDRALKILVDITEAEAEVSSKVGSPKGNLRVGASSQIGRQRIAPLISRFTDQFPGINVQLILSDSGLEVIDDELDIAIRVGLPNEQDVVARKLLDGKRLICAAPAYLKRCGTPLVPGDLLEHRCIRLVRGRRVFDRWLFEEEGQRREVQVRGALSTTSGEVVYDWVLAGRGIAMKASWDIDDDLREGRLVECLATYACDEISLYAVFATRRHMPPRLRAFVDFIAAALNRSQASS
jgi:DNA-binding transcriptional LysR family regulator